MYSVQENKLKKLTIYKLDKNQFINNGNEILFFTNYLK